MGFSGSVLRNSATTSLRSSLSSEPPDDASLIADRKSSGITAKLEQNRVSDNVGGVKHFLSVLLRALRRARHFALVEKQLPVPTKARSQSIQIRCRSDPCISSVTTAIMITTADSPEKGSGTPNQFLGVLLHTIAMSGLSHVRTELLPLLVVPSLAPHPVQANGQLTYPDPRKIILQQEFQNMPSILAIGLLLAPSFRSDRLRISPPQLHSQPFQQPLKPLRLPAGLHANTYPLTHRGQPTIELLCFLGMC